MSNASPLFTTSHLARATLYTALAQSFAFSLLLYVIPSLWTSELSQFSWAIFISINALSLLRGLYYLRSKQLKFQSSIRWYRLGYAINCVPVFLWSLFVAKVTSVVGLDEVGFFLVISVITVIMLNTQFFFFELKLSILVTTASSIPFLLGAVFGESSDLLGLGAFLFFLASSLSAYRAHRIYSFAQKTKEELERSHQREFELSRLSSLGILAGGISHEINNPLFIIRGQVEMLERSLNSALESGELSSQSKVNMNLFKKIFSTIDRVNKTIKGLRLLAKDGSSLPLENIKIRDVLDQVVELYRSRVTESNAQLSIDLKVPEYFEVRANSVQLTQILFNLVGNAFDEISKNPSDPWIQVTVSENSGKALIQVANFGQPIRGEALGKLFVPFYTTKDPGKGTGLGLVISRSMAEAQGGTLRYVPESEFPLFEVTLCLPGHTLSKKIAS